MTTFDEFGTGETDNSYDSDEAGFDEASEYDDSESRRSRAVARRKDELRRRQLQRMRLQRARAAPAGGSRLPVQQRPVPAVVGREVRETQAAIQEMGLESQVHAAGVRRALTAQSKSARDIQLALAGIAGVTQVLSDFGTKSPLNNAVAQAALRAGPLFLLPRSQGSFFTSPTFVGSALVGASALGKQIFDSVESKEVVDVEIRQAPTQLKGGARFTLKAVALDRKNQVIRDVVPELTLEGATPEVAQGSGIFVVAGTRTDVVVTAKAGGKETTLVIPVG